MPKQMLAKTVSRGDGWSASRTVYMDGTVRWYRRGPVPESAFRGFPFGSNVHGDSDTADKDDPVSYLDKLRALSAPQFIQRAR